MKLVATASFILNAVSLPSLFAQTNDALSQCTAENKSLVQEHLNSYGQQTKRYNRLYKMPDVRASAKEYLQNDLEWIQYIRDEQVFFTKNASGICPVLTSAYLKFLNACLPVATDHLLAIVNMKGTDSEKYWKLSQDILSEGAPYMFMPRMTLDSLAEQIK